MTEEGANVDLVETQQLAEFANSLYRYLYSKCEVEYEIVEVRSAHFRPVIGSAVLHMERHACKYISEIIDRSCFEVSKSILCQTVCNACQNFPYFNKLYYMSAFILDLMLYLNNHSEATNLTEGPSLWIEIFQKNFGDDFERSGGWQGFADAGRVLLQCQSLPREALKPKFAMAPTGTADFLLVMSGLGSLVPTCEDTTDVIMDEAEDTFEKLKLSPIKEVGELETAKAQIEGAEGIQPEQVGENPKHPAAVEGGRKRRKRRHDAGPSDSDKEPDSVSPSKAKLERKNLDSSE